MVRSKIKKTNFRFLFPAFSLSVRLTQVTDKNAKLRIVSLQGSSSGWLSSIPILSMLKHCPCYFPPGEGKRKNGFAEWHVAWLCGMT